MANCCYDDTAEDRDPAYVMSDFASFLVVCLFVAAAVVWLVMAVHSFRMMANRQKGNWGFFVDPLWWLPGRARKHFTEEGMAHYRRAMKTMPIFFGLILLMMAVYVPDAIRFSAFPTLLLVTSSRDELLVTLANLYAMPEYAPNIAGFVVTGVAPVSHITQQIIDRSGIPYVRTTKTTADIFITISEDVSKLTADDQEKINLIQELSPKRFDFEYLDRLFAKQKA